MSMYEELKKGNRTLTEKVEKLELLVKELEEKNKEYEDERVRHLSRIKYMEQRIKKYEELSPIKNVSEGVENNSFATILKVISALKMD